MKRIARVLVGLFICALWTVGTVTFSSTSAQRSANVHSEAGTVSGLGMLATSTSPTPSPTPTNTPPSPTPSATPTSWPGPPTLHIPENYARLPQPVPPNQWYFDWNARDGPCYCVIWIWGPGGRCISARVDYLPGDYCYVYAQTEFLPNDALAPWYWRVGVICPLGSNVSETRVFSVEPAFDFEFHIFLPVVNSGNPAR